MKKRYNRIARCIPAALVGSVVLGSVTSTHGTIISSNVLNGDGTVTYSYLVDNTGGSFDIAAWALDFGFPSPDWDQVDTFSGGGVTVPNLDWFADVGTPVSGLSAQDFITTGKSGEVLAGQSLSGFSFTSHYLPGTVQYHEFSADGAFANGVTVGPAVAQAVPEGAGPVEAIACASLLAFALSTRKFPLSPRGNS